MSLEIESEQMLGIPVGYRPGLGRDYPHPRISHLYEIGEDIMDFGFPMCRYGWNRGGYGYSIWRGNIGNGGVCKVCLKRAKAGLKGIDIPEDMLEDTTASEADQSTSKAKVQDE